MSKIIEVSSLSKAYGSIQAVKSIDFYVEEGSLFAFLGTNGAGKSTTIDMLSTLLRPDSGDVIINGYTLGNDDNAIRNTIGMVFQDSLLDPLLTVKENLYLRGGFYGFKRSQLKEAVQHAANVADVTEFINRPYGKLSGGQRRRADIARALIHTPKILFLDEPTTGLDPQTRKRVWQTIRSLQKEKGMTVFLTTHYMEEAAQADYITIIGKGEILAKGTPLELKQAYSKDRLTIKAKDNKALENKMNQEKISYIYKGGQYHIALNSTPEAIPLLALLKEHVENMEVVNGTMDDVFLNVVGEEVIK